MMISYFEPFWQSMEWTQSWLVHLTVITLFLLFTFAVFENIYSFTMNIDPEKEKSVRPETAQQISSTTDHLEL